MNRTPDLMLWLGHALIWSGVLILAGLFFI
jgi:hypothetical protein